jgi:hypothetical protein
MFNQSVAIWLLIALAFAMANLPFLNERLMALIPLKRIVKKPPFMIVGELFAWYVIVGLVAYAFETALVNPFPRGWEFYVVNLCIFMVLGFPGFVYRYLLKN